MSTTPHDHGGAFDAVPLERLEREWATLATRLRSELRRWRASEPALARHPSAQALIGLLHGHASYASKDELLIALLRLARSEPLAGRVVLQALLPGLKRLARQLLFEAGEREEVWELLLANAWEQICCYPLARRPRRIAANILLDTLRPTLRELKRQRRQRSESTVEAAPASPPTDADVDVDLLLAEAVAAGAVSPLEAEAILAVRIDGDPLATVAVRLGAERARTCGALGPVGRGSGFDDDDRRNRAAELGRCESASPPSRTSPAQPRV